MQVFYRKYFYNAKFRHNAGLSCYIERKDGHNCCKWCAGLAGKYKYPDEVPKDVYRRHDNCTCDVTYVSEKGRQNVHTKQYWSREKNREYLRQLDAEKKAKRIERQMAGLDPKKATLKRDAAAKRRERIEKAESMPKPMKLTKAEAHAKQSEILAQRQLTYDRKRGIITEKKITSADEEYNSVLLKKYNKGTDTAKAVYDKYIPYDKTVEDYHYPKNPHHSPKNHMICLDVDKDKNNPRGAGTTWFHEHGHYIDYEKNYFSCNDDYLEAIRNDVKNFEASVKTAHNYRSKSDMRMAIGSELVGLGDISHSIQDIYGGAIGKPYPGTRYVHKKEYWNRHGRYGVCKEAFAHMYEASFTPEKAKLMEQYLPTAWAEFNKMLGGIV